MFTPSMILVVAAVMLPALFFSISFGRSILREKDGEEKEVLENFKKLSRAEIDRIVCPEPFYGYDPISRGKKHRTSRAV